MTDNIEELKFLAEKSNQLVIRQVDSYRQAHGKAGTIIGVIALFIPFFLNGLDDSPKWLKICSILPVAVLSWAMLLLLMVLRSSPLKQGVNIKKMPEFINKGLQEILLFEISVNHDSFVKNDVIIKLSNKRYNFAVILTIAAILISAGVLMTNKFLESKPKEPIEVKIINHD